MKIKEYTFPVKKRNCSDYCPEINTKNCTCKKMDADIELCMLWIGFMTCYDWKDHIPEFVEAYNSYQNSEFGELVTDVQWALLNQSDLVIDTYWIPGLSVLENFRKMRNNVLPQIHELVKRYYNKKGMT